MAGYSSRQSTFTTGDTITAAHSNNEFNAVLAAFHVSTGHKHDGSTAGDGGPISTLFSNAISMGTGADTDIALTFNANTNDGVLTWMEDQDYFQFSNDILISTAEKLHFRDTAIYVYSSTDGQLDLIADTKIQVTATTIGLSGAISGTGVADEDNMSSDSATKLATQQSIKAYVDAKVTAEDLDVTSDSGTIAIDLDSETLTVAGGTGLASSATSNTVTLAIDSTVSTLTGSQTLTNKTLTSPVVNTGISGTAIADEDDMSSNSATKLATQQSIKAYVDATVTAEDLDVTSDSGTIAIDLDSETLTIAGGTGLASSATSSTVTLAIDSTVTTLTGSQTLTNKTLTSPVLNTGVSGTAVADEDNMSSNSATKLATQQSIKAYVDGQVGGVSTTWTLEDDDGTEVAVASGKEVKFIGSGLTTNWTDTDNGTDADPYDLTFTVDAAQTGITSLLAADIKIGEDNETKIDFETANEIHLYANNAEQVYVADGIFGPETDSDVDLGTTGVRWKDAFIDTITTTGAVTVGGDLTVNGTTTTVNSTTVTIDDPIFTLGGDSAPGSDDNKDRGIEFRWHNGSAAKVGFFGYDDNAAAFTFIPDATNSSEVFSGSVGNAIFNNVTGTLQTVAQTNITSVGALNGGSITSGFGTIDTGASAITTTGLISGGSLDIDNVLINGTTIGHTDDTDLLTLADGALTVAGTIEATGNITGTLATAAQGNITSTGALGGGSIAAGFGAIDNGTSGIRTNIFTAETSVVPDASGGADLGTTSLEWGNLYIADDKKIALGSDQNFTIEYDENGNDTTAVVAATGLSLAPHGTSAGNGTELRFQELAANGAHYVGFKAPDSVAANKVFILPNADGSADQVLKTDGSLALDWVDQAGGGSIERVADGAIAIRKPVILTSAGKAAQIVSSTSVASTLTLKQITDMDGSDTATDYVATTYEASSERFVLFYRDTSNSNYPTIVAGAWSNGTVTWGTPLAIESGAIANEPSIDSGDGYVFTHYDTGDAKMKIFSISGTTFTLTATETIQTTNPAGNKIAYVPSSAFSSSPYDPVSGIACCVYSHSGTGSEVTYVRSYCIRASNGTNNGQTTEEAILSTNAHMNRSDMVADPDTGKAIYATFDGTSGDVGKAFVIGFGGTASSPTDTVGTPVVYSESGHDADHTSICYDTQNNKVFIAYHDDNADSSDQMWKGVIGTVTAGTNAISFTGRATIWDGDGNLGQADVAFDTVANKIGFFYRDADNSNILTYKTITPGASSFSVANGATMSNGDAFLQANSATYGTGKGFLVGLNDRSDSNVVAYASGYYATSTSTNLTATNYLGVSAAAISDTATGKIHVISGLSTGHSSLTIGSNYFATDAGGIATSGTTLIGKALSATEILLKT
mgnify:CR=1 FL=1